MDPKQTYNESGVKFMHKGAGNWEFTLPTVSAYVFISKCPGGKIVAQRVAKILIGAVKRTHGNGVDGMARAMIRKLISPAKKHYPIVY
jgi:hypothetical protein